LAQSGERGTEGNVRDIYTLTQAGKTKEERESDPTWARALDLIAGTDANGTLGLKRKAWFTNFAMGVRAGTRVPMITRGSVVDKPRPRFHTEPRWEASASVRFVSEPSRATTPARPSRTSTPTSAAVKLSSNSLPAGRCGSPKRTASRSEVELRHASCALSWRPRAIPTTNSSPFGKRVSPDENDEARPHLDHGR